MPQKVELCNRHPKPVMSLSVRAAVASFSTEKRKTYFFFSSDIAINLSIMHQLQLTVPQDWLFHFLGFFEVIWAEEGSDLRHSCALWWNSFFRVLKTSSECANQSHHYSVYFRQHSFFWRSYYVLKDQFWTYFIFSSKEKGARDEMICCPYLYHRTVMLSTPLAVFMIIMFYES